MFKETVYHGTIQQKADAIVKEGCECQPKSEPLAHEFLSHSCS